MAVASYLDTLNTRDVNKNITGQRATVRISSSESWPRAVGFDQYPQITSGGYTYGGGMLLGPLTAAQIASLTADGYVNQIITQNL